MGTSCDAHLLYGILIDADEYECSLQVEGEGWKDWEELYAEKHGIFRPDARRSEDPEAFDDWYSRKGALVEEAGIDVGCFGYYDAGLEESSIFVHVKKRHVWASGCMHEEVGFDFGMADKDADDALLMAFCDKMGIEYKEPHWYVASDFS